MSLSNKIIPKLARFLCCTILLAVFTTILTNNTYAQEIKKVIHSENAQAVASDSSAAKDSAALSSDTLDVQTDSVASKKKRSVADSSAKGRLEDSLGIKISKDELPAPVTTDAADSAVGDMKSKTFYLYGSAKVNYQDMKLEAGEVSFNQSNDIITAAPSADSAGIASARPSFAQGSETFTYDSMQYNFKSKRAIVRNARSKYGEGYVYSEQVKRSPDQSIFGAHSIYTTCSLDTPHYGIVASKIRVIPGRAIASGPANIVIEGVPTPIFIPFAFFPITQGQHSGFIIPSYTIEDQRGLGLTNGGYYFALSDHADLLTEANIYTKGSYSISGVSTYKSLYHYSGGISLSYAYNKTGEVYEPGSSITKDFMLQWQHQTDAKSIPGQTLTANVTAGTSTFFSNNSYDPSNILQNQYSSNITFSKSWLGTPFSLNISARHSQDTRSHLVQVTLPDVNFHVTQINPFQSKKRSGASKWYDKITLSYTFDMLNQTSFIDSTFSLGSLSLKSFNIGAHHSIPISASYTIFRYVNMSFAVNYDEYWLTDQIYQQYNPYTYQIDSNETRGFFTARDFNTSLNFSTRIYGMKMFKHGKLAGIRHVLTPNVGFSYHPDFAQAPFNYYYKTRLDSITDPVRYQYITQFPSSIVGVPVGPGKAGNVGLGLNNNLQIKVHSSKDTVTGFKNVTLIDALSVATAYNIAADSFNWSHLVVNFRTNVLDKVNISASADFDPYELNYATGYDINKLMIQNGQGIGRFTSGNIALGTNFHSKPLNSSKDVTNSEEYGRLMRSGGINNYANFNIPWSVNVSYSMNATEIYAPLSLKDTLQVSQNITFQGDFNVTERWKVSVSSGYNVTLHELTFTSLNIYRDLHCWEMSMQTIPFGPRKSFTFTLKVKAAVLQDLKLVRRRDYRDAVGY